MLQVAGNGGRYTRGDYYYFFFAIRLKELFDNVPIYFDKIKTKSYKILVKNQEQQNTTTFNEEAEKRKREKGMKEEEGVVREEVKPWKRRKKRQ